MLEDDPRDEREPRMAPRLRACGIVMGADAAHCSDHFPIWAEFA